MRCHFSMTMILLHDIFFIKFFPLELAGLDPFFGEYLGLEVMEPDIDLLGMTVVEGSNCRSQSRRSGV